MREIRRIPDISVLMSKKSADGVSYNWWVRVESKIEWWSNNIAEEIKNELLYKLQYVGFEWSINNEELRKFIDILRFTLKWHIIYRSDDSNMRYVVNELNDEFENYFRDSGNSRLGDVLNNILYSLSGMYLPNIRKEEGIKYIKKEVKMINYATIYTFLRYGYSYNIFKDNRCELYNEIAKEIAKKYKYITNGDELPFGVTFDYLSGNKELKENFILWTSDFIKKYFNEDNTREVLDKFFEYTYMSEVKIWKELETNENEFENNMQFIIQYYDKLKSIMSLYKNYVDDTMARKYNTEDIINKVINGFFIPFHKGDVIDDRKR